MKVILVFLSCLTIALATEYTFKNSVLILTDKTIDSAFEEFDYVYCLFEGPLHAPCGTTRATFYSNAKYLANINPNIKFANIDCSVEQRACAKHDIGEGNYHISMFFVKGKRTAFDRYDSNIVNWIRKQAEPVSINVTTIQEAYKFVNDNEVACLFFGTIGSDAHTAFLSAASTFGDVFFAQTDDEALREKYEVQGEAIVLFRKIDEGKALYEGAYSTAHITNFINSNIDPPVYPYEKIPFLNSDLDSIYLIVDQNETSSNAESTFRTIANDLKGKLTFVIVQIEQERGSTFARLKGVSRDNLPTVRIIERSYDGNKFAFKNDFTAENLKVFIQDFLDGKLKPYFKSQPVPEELFENNVKVVVGNNFEEIVLNPDNDVLILYYGPGPRSLFSDDLLDSLGTKVKDVQGLVIAKMDINANEAPNIRFMRSGLKFYPKGQKQSPIDAQYLRMTEQLIGFLQRYSSASLNHLDITTPAQNRSVLDDFIDYIDDVYRGLKKVFKA